MVAGRGGTSQAVLGLEEQQESCPDFMPFPSWLVLRGFSSQVHPSPPLHLGGQFLLISIPRTGPGWQKGRDLSPLRLAQGGKNQNL